MLKKIIRGNQRQYIWGAVLSYGGIAFSVISGLFYTPWMIKIIGDNQYALYALAMSVINLFMMDFGIGGAVSKFLAGFYAQGQKDEANSFLGIVYKIFFLIDVFIVICLVVFYFFIEVIYVKFTPEELLIFKRLFVIVAIYSVVSFPFTTFNGVLNANEKFIELKLCGVIQQVLNVVLIAICLLCQTGVYALVFVHAFTNLLIIAIKYIIIKKATHVKANMLFQSKTMTKELLGFSAWTTITALAQRCIFNVMPSIISILIGSAEVTMFSVAVSLEGYVYTFTQAINGMFLPKISRINVNESRTSKLQELMCSVGKFHVYTLGLLYIGFLCVGEQFVEVWMGKGYSLVFVCAAIIILPSLLDTPQQVARTSLLVNNILKEPAMIYIGMAAVNIVLSIVLIKVCGVVGSAISICIAYLFRTIMFNVLYVKKLSIKIGDYVKNVYGKWCIIGGATLPIGLFVRQSIEISGWGGILVKMVSITLVYVVLVWIFGLSKTDKVRLVNNVIREKGNQ